MALLESAFLGRLEQLQLATRRPLTGRLGGDHRSLRHGTSLDFADYREYHPGDDFRRIDYQLLARLDVLALKLFEADDDLQVRLLIDTSASMGWAGKFAQAQKLAAALGFVALVRRDAVSVHTFGADRKLQAPRFIGRNAASSLFAHLESLHPQGNTQFSAAVAELLGRPGPRGLTIVISDLMTTEWEAAINRLPARGGDVVIVHVLDPSELEPTAAGDLELVDSESGDHVAVSLSEQTRADYTALVERWLSEVALRCRSVNAGYSLVLADQDIEPLLLAAWRADGIVG